jgi:hypothetical protein
LGVPNGFFLPRRYLQLLEDVPVTDTNITTTSGIPIMQPPERQEASTENFEKDHFRVIEES